MSRKKQEIDKDFSIFVSVSKNEPSAQVQEKILSYIYKELNPSRMHLFLKILVTHALVSILSLSFCSQFGIQTFYIYDVMKIFMNFLGETYCFLLCGFFYFSISSLFFSFLFKSDEIRIIRYDYYFQLFLLIGFSMIVWIYLSSDVFLFPSLLWIGGAITGGVGTFEVGWMMRSQCRITLAF